MTITYKKFLTIYTIESLVSPPDLLLVHCVNFILPVYIEKKITWGNIYIFFSISPYIWLQWSLEPSSLITRSQHTPTFLKGSLLALNTLIWNVILSILTSQIFFIVYKICFGSENWRDYISSRCVQGVDFP